MNMWRRYALGLAVSAGFAASTWAASPLRGSASDWQLDFEFHDPQRITFRAPGSGKATTYWYVLYRVTNNSGRDVQFYPSFRLVTDTLKVVEGGADVHPRVFDLVVARHGREYPFLTTPAKAIGLLLQGEDNARSSVIVFREFDPKADSFSLFISGLSGKVERIGNPAFDVNREEAPDNPRFFLLRRTLAVTYNIPGDPGTRRSSTPVRRNREWLMR